MITFKRLKEFYLPYKKYFFWSLISLLGVTGMTVVYPIILQIAIDSVSEGEYDIIPILVLTLLVATLIKSVTAFINQYYGDLFGISSVYQLRKALYKKLQFLPFKYYDNAKTGDLMSRLTADVEGFRFFLSFGFAQLVNLILLMVFSFSVMFFYSVPLTLMTIVTLPFLCVTVYMFDKRVHPRFRGIRVSLAALNTKVQENVSGVQTVKALSQEDEESKRFDSKNEDYRMKHIDIAKVWGKYFPLMETIGNMSSVILIGFGGYLAISGGMSPGEFVAFFSLIGFIIGPIMQLGFIMNTFSQSKASGERLLEILDAEERIDEQRFDKEKVRLLGEVQYENVDLAYHSESSTALKGISFHAQKGQTIGLVGATGSGKSSVIQLLTRFYQKTDGEIFLDGKPIEEYSMKQIRSNIGVVLQETFLFSSTIKDNISYGVANASMEEIIAAAKRADAHEFISELPEGYDTVLGERGLGLSGGQKQRIAIARAILMDPAILIMDDATSAVDMQTEVKIQKAFREVMEGRTTFIIAHRISSVKHADQILVLEQGEVVERGTHEQLLQNESGMYRRIYDIQNQDQQYVLQQA